MPAGSGPFKTLPPCSKLFRKCSHADGYGRRTSKRKRERRKKKGRYVCICMYKIKQCPRVFFLPVSFVCPCLSKSSVPKSVRALRMRAHPPRPAPHLHRRTDKLHWPASYCKRKKRPHVREEKKQRVIIDHH